MVPLIVSLWLFTGHGRPGSGFREGKSPSLGPRMTVMGELSLMGLTPRERGLDFLSFVECGVFLCVCVCGVVFWSGFGFELCVLQ